MRWSEPPASRFRRALAVALIGFGPLAASACAGRDEEPAPPASPSGQPTESVASRTAAPGDAEGSAPTESAPAQAASGSCPGDMALVEGKFCVAAQQRCLERQSLGIGVPETSPERLNCQHYAEPSVCLRPDLSRPVRYCMDRYEWPNKKGELPRTLVTWLEARDVCSSVGKRLCTDDEFTFACEGEAMRPYVYGFSRDATKCNVDRPYRPRTFTFLPWEPCMADEACHAAFTAIDQRVPAGSLEGCKGDALVYDLNGNVNEWVLNTKSRERAGIKGGWWGPVRNRCRPTVTFHREGDFGYEVGFRCCADAK